MSTPLVLLASLALFIGCAPHRSAASASTAHAALDRARRCADIDCYRQIERNLLANQLRDLVTRSGDSLLLTVDDSTVALIDHDVPNDSAVVFSYVAHLTPINQHLLHAALYEGRVFVFVNEFTGQRVIVDNFPIFSADLTRFATGMSDALLFPVDRLEIWRAEGQVLIREWSVEPDGWGPTDLTWYGPTTLHVGRVSLGLETLEPYTAVLDPGGWSFRP